jgi:hypothetical protein
VVLRQSDVADVLDGAERPDPRSASGSRASPSRSHAGEVAEDAEPPPLNMAWAMKSGFSCRFMFDTSLPDAICAS